jgi:hypothetical protein
MKKGYFGSMNTCCRNITRVTKIMCNKYSLRLAEPTTNQQCTSTLVPYHVPTMYLNHIPYHSIMPYTMYHMDISSKYHQMVYLNKVPKTKIIYQVYASTMHLICASSMCQCLNNIPKTCLKHAP